MRLKSFIVPVIWLIPVVIASCQLTKHHDLWAWPVAFSMIAPVLFAFPAVVRIERRRTVHTLLALHKRTLLIFSCLAVSALVLIVRAIWQHSWTATISGAFLLPLLLIAGMASIRRIRQLNDALSGSSEYKPS